MFITFGQKPDKDRLKNYGNLTKYVPIDVFRASCRTAALEANSFMPGPGDIMRCALKLAPGQLNPGHPRSLPKWYQAAIGSISRAEQPKELGPRTGMTRVDVITDGRLS